MANCRSRRPDINASARNQSPKWSSTITSSSVCFFSLGIVFGVVPILVEQLIAPRKRSLAKGDTYECGVKTYGETWVRFRIQYYIYALMFVVFDIETVSSFRGRSATPDWGHLHSIEMIVFLVMLLVGLIYAWAKGVLRWV